MSNEIKIVDVESLNRAAVTYDNVLRTLPYLTLEEIIQKFRLNTLEMTGKHVRTTFERKGGIMKPYSGTVSDQEQQEIGRLKESALEMELAYCNLFDSIQNYKDVKVLSNAGEKVDNKSKKHPLEKKILETVVRTWSEDVIDALFFAERNTDDQSPMGAFDGYETKLLALIASGEVSVAKGNLIESGAITAPDDEEDTTAIAAIVNWFKQLDPKLRRQKVTWMVPDSVLLHALNSLQNAKRNRSDVTIQHLIDHIKTFAMVSNLDIVTDACLGTGGRWYATAPGMMDFGMNTKTDGKFVQVRNILVDPNIVQFWIQAEYGTRWNEWHPKMFACNEQAAVANGLSGDYTIS